MRAFGSGLAAFREGMVISSIADPESFSDFDARRVRYEWLWSSHEQNQYRNVRRWATGYRTQFALYKHIRSIHSPTYRLGAFNQAHIFGGQLDHSAAELGAIPITTENEALRLAISELWKWSRWGVNKDILSLWGTVYGDVMLRVVDDVRHGRSYLEVMYPGEFAEIIKDPFGAVKGYTLQKQCENPNGAGEVTYTEIVSRSGDLVVYETFLNGKPYAWPDNVDRTGTPMQTWSQPYTFVPLVHIMHNDVGLDWGWSEIQPAFSKIHEADDLASLISDHIRKNVATTPWLATGTKPGDLSTSETAATTDRPAPGREELDIVYGPKDATLTPFVTDLDLEDSLAHLNGVLEELERDFPELSSDIHTASGDASGRALRVARQRVVAKVIQRRANYDAGLVQAMQMAIAIGGWREYEGYDGFNLDSYAKGDLSFSVADRPVFENDPLDDSEISAAFWTAATAAKGAGVPLESYLREAGWSDERIKELGIIEQEEEDESEE